MGTEVMKPCDLYANAVATNALASAAIAAPAGNTHLEICSVSASFSGTGTALCQLKAGPTVIQQWYVTNTAPLQITYANPLRLPPGIGCTLELAAGGAGVIGATSLAGYAL